MKKEKEIYIHYNEIWYDNCKVAKTLEEKLLDIEGKKLLIVKKIEIIYKEIYTKLKNFDKVIGYKKIEEKPYTIVVGWVKKYKEKLENGQEISEIIKINNEEKKKIKEILKKERIENIYFY